MNEIDQILSNIDKDDDEFFKQSTDAKRDEEISQMIESLDGQHDSAVASPAPEADEAVEHEKTAAAGDLQPDSVAVQEQEADSKAFLAVTEGLFSLRGSKNWNRHEPYIIPVDPDGYRNDVEALQKSFFFVEDPSDRDDIKQKIKQEIVAYLRKPTGNITDRYTDFIFKKISVAAKELSDNFKLDREADRLFIYHIGPLTVYKYLKDDFYKNKYGYCYKYLPGNKAAMFFPDDFIKITVLKWYEENINTLDIPFDSIQRYEEMKKIAMRKYYNDLRIFNTRLEQLNAKLGADKSISRVKLFQVKGIPWFGHLNLEVYRRFIGGTIFM